MDVSLQEIALINLEKDVAIRRLEEQLAQHVAATAKQNGHRETICDCGAYTEDGHSDTCMRNADAVQPVDADSQPA